LSLPLPVCLASLRVDMWHCTWMHWSKVPQLENAGYFVALEKAGYFFALRRNTLHRFASSKTNCDCFPTMDGPFS